MEAVPPWPSEETLYTQALKPHQQEIIGLVARGLTHQEIAARLGTTPGWVGTQIGRIVQRIGLTRRADIVACYRGRPLPLKEVAHGSRLYPPIRFQRR